MKDKIKKIITLIGFIVVAVSAIIVGMENIVDITAYIPAIFALCFIFSNKKNLENFGYAISSINLGIGLSYVWYEQTMIYAIGLIIMSVASIFYFIEIIFGFFGFVINKSKNQKYSNKEIDDFAEIEKYAQMVTEGILSEKEFSELKSRIFDIKAKKSSSIEDLKRWKKLLDKNIITEEEYASKKAVILG